MGKRASKPRKVYFVSDAQGRIKIGSANNVFKRLEQLQAGNADPLILLGIEEGGFKREKALQKQFAHLHVRGEWFSPGKELTDYIDSLACPSGSLEDIRRAVRLGIYGKFSQERLDLVREDIVKTYGYP